MFIMCQKCHTFYQVPKDLIVSQEMTFKCQKCGFTWTTHVDDDVEAPPEALSETDDNTLPDDTDEIFGAAVAGKKESVLPASANVFAPVPEERHSALLFLPIMALILLVLNIVLFFDQGKLPLLLGKEVLTPLVIQNVSFDVLNEKTGPQLRVFAQVMNTRAQTIPAAPIVVTLFDDKDNPIRTEEIPLPYKEYEPHQIVPIDYVIDSMNVRTRRIEVKVQEMAV